MNKFKIGDRVKFVDDNDNFSDMFLYGEYGKVKIIDDNYIGVEFDNFFDDCHDLDNNSKKGYGWWCDEDQLISVESKSCEESKVCFETENKYVCVHILFKNGKVLKDVFKLKDNESVSVFYKKIINSLKKEKDQKQYISTPNNLIIDIDDISAIKVIEGNDIQSASQDLF